MNGHRIDGQDFRSGCAAAKYLVGVKHMTIKEAAQKLHITESCVHLAATKNGQESLKRGACKQRVRNLVASGRYKIEEIATRVRLSVPEVKELIKMGLAKRGRPAKSVKVSTPPTPSAAKKPAKKVVKKSTKKAPKKTSVKVVADPEDVGVDTVVLTPDELDAKIEAANGNSDPIVNEDPAADDINL